MNRKLEKQIQAEYQLSKTRKYELVTEGGKEGRNNFVFKQEQSVHRSEEIDKRGKRQTMEKGYKKVFIKFKNTEFNCKIRKYEFFSSQCQYLGPMGAKIFFKKIYLKMILATKIF